MIERWINRAKEIGFSKAALLDVQTLKPRPDVRATCTADKCGAFGKNWTCPPHCGDLETCTERIQSYHRGILLQTVGEMKRSIDYKTMVKTGERHIEMFYQLCDEIRSEHPHALYLGAGGCRICGKCAYPEPCRFPERACSSMEGYGLLVSQVCKDNNVQYYYGEKTITYTACILFD